MLKFDSLPIILVSAINQTAAATLISELIDKDVTDDYLKDTQSQDRVWRLENKYYTANVRVHPVLDSEQLDVDPDLVEAHIVHITEDELSDGSAGVARAAARAAGWRRCAVRAVLADSSAPPAALAAWAAAQRAHAVALRAARGADAGLEHARAALHAHVWRGLQRTDRPHPLHPPETPAAGGWSSCSDESSCSDSEAEEMRSVERAEAFAAALGALGPALEARGPAGPCGPGRADQHERAEALVRAFCRALGLDPDE